MADRLPLSALSDSELEQRLIDLRPRLYPTTPDLATQVRHRLESEPGGALTPNPLSRRAGRGGYVLPSPRSEGPGTRKAGGVGDEGRSWGSGEG
jgi:hypothetical protein